MKPLVFTLVFLFSFYQTVFSQIKPGKILQLVNQPGLSPAKVETPKVWLNTEELDLSYNLNTFQYDTTYDRLYHYHNSTYADQERVYSYSPARKESGREQYLHDSMGRSTGYIYQLVDDNGNATNYSRQQISYDDKGNYKYVEYDTWNGFSWAISSNYKYEYTYDNKDKLINRTIMVNYGDGVWHGYFKIDAIRDLNETVLSTIIYRVDSTGAFQPGKKLVNASYFRNNMFYPEKGEEVYYINGAWDTLYKYNAVYDSLYTLLSGQVDSIVGSKLITVERETYKFDSHGYRYYYTQEYYRNRALVITDGLEDNIVYDSNGNLDTDEELRYNPYTRKWRKYMKYIYTFSEETGLKDNISQAANISTYPNPVDDELHVKISDSKGMVKLSLYDIAGRIVYSSTESGSDVISIPVSSLNKGMYVLKTEMGGEITSKFVIKE